MPGLRKAEIANRLTRFLVRSNVKIHSAEFSGVNKYLPWRVLVEFQTRVVRKYEIYMWTISHGGRTRSKDEYRIQIILKDGENRLDFGFGTTLLLGYYDEHSDYVGRSVGNLPTPDMEIIVAWDPIRHLQVGASSSCQVQFDILKEAYRKGVATRKCSLSQGESEQIIALRPEYFAGYLAKVSGGHHLLMPETIINL